METRELFWAISASGKALFYVIGLTAIVASIAGIVWHVSKYRSGRRLSGRIDISAGLRRLALVIITHRTVARRDRFAGVAHAGVFFGFVILFIGTAIITLDYDIVQPLLHVSFWHGTFFLWFSLILDMGGLVAVVGLLAFIIRRSLFHLPKLSYLRAYRAESALRPAAKRWRIEDWIFLLALLYIMMSGFLAEALRHAMERPTWALWEPVGELISRALLRLSPTPSTLAMIRSINWWVHGIAALIFLAALPWYKAKHMLAAMGSLFARDPLTLARLPKAEAHGVSLGVATVADFTWKDILDFDACTKCGRCHEVCPARATGAPLSPRDLILDLRGLSATATSRSAVGSLVQNVIAPETLWACMTCGACQEVCPVGIEHPVKIVKMRRQLVEERKIDPLLQRTLTAIANTGNSFNENSRRRSAWVRELTFRVKDIRKEPADNLWFVGDYASFDPRNQKVSRAFAGLLRAAKVDFGLLHEGERTAGNDVRRVGEEGLYESLVHHNQAQMRAAQPFTSIITTDPHSFNTIRNEYPEFGPTAPIRHYTEVLRELLESGRLQVRQRLSLRVTLHDPCHLGRLNKRYDDPRRVLELIGCEIVEMPRNRENSFCCGAGGGRIWMADPPGKKKPSQLRVEEAASLGGLDAFVTCCPKDLTMFEDARKTAGLENAFVVEDIAELVARAVSLETLQLHEVPKLVEQISAAVVDRISERLETRLRELAGASQIAAVARPVTDEATSYRPDRPTDQTISAASEVAPAQPPTSGSQWRVAPYTPASFSTYVAPAKTGHRVLVAVKQVAKLVDEFKISEQDNSIAKEYFDYQLNEFDDVALEEALKTAEAVPETEVVVVTVGDSSAEDTLRKALAKGAHRGIRISSESTHIGDPLAIARLIAGVATIEKPDLVFCGVQSSDQAHGATGAALARLLGMSCAAVVVGTEWSGGDRIQVTRELEGGLRHQFRLPVPAVVTIQAGANTPRYASMKMLKQAKTKPIAEVDAQAEDTIACGAAVACLALPSTRRARILPGTPAEAAAEVLRLIRVQLGDRS